MRAAVLRDFFEGRASAGELAAEAADSIVREAHQQTHLLEDLREPFTLTVPHLVRLCDAVVSGELPPEAMEAIGYTLAESERFTWDGHTEEGARITLTVTQWASPESSYALTADAVAKYRRRLLTGERAFPREDSADRRATPRIHRVTGSRVATPDAGVVAVAGGTGLVGREVLRLLADRPPVKRIVALARREMPASVTGQLPAGRLLTRLVDFDRIADVDPAVLDGATSVICALGTTMKTAGSKEAFHRVDHDYVIALARLAQRAGVRHFLLVTALGADAWSRVFYNRVKGETERDVRAIGFPALTIVRPSLLLGDREEFRPAERIASLFARFVPGRYRPVKASDVARVLVDAALDPSATGAQVLESDVIRRLSRGE